MTFKEFFRFSDEDLKKYKIVLNSHHGETGSRFIDEWQLGSDIGWSYWSHRGGRRNFQENDLVFGFVNTYRDTYLLVTAGRVTRVPAEAGPCDHEELEEFKPFIGKLLVKTHKGQTFSSYIFSLSKYLSKPSREIEIIGIDGFKKLEFTGFENVSLNFRELAKIVETDFAPGYRAALASVFGVYVLTDTACGRLYVGSAYGLDGVAGRWENYFRTGDGNNVELIQLRSEKGDEYIRNNFKFTLLEWFDRKIPIEKVIERESWWKNVFETRRFGYNLN